MDCGTCRGDMCGDRVCGGIETCRSCIVDCGECTVLPKLCGNMLCERGESCANCSRDCGTCNDVVIKHTPPVRVCTNLQCCGDGACQVRDGEVAENCLADCRPKPSLRCGDTFCSTAKEDCANCAQDCGLCSPENPSRITQLRLREQGYFYCKEEGNNAVSLCSKEEYCLECKEGRQLEGDCAVCNPALPQKIFNNARRLTENLLTQVPHMAASTLPPGVQQRLSDGFRSFQEVTKPYTDPVIAFLKAIPIGWWIVAFLVLLTIMMIRRYREKQQERQKQWLI